MSQRLSSLERVLIINTLYEQDRIEVREKIEIVLKITYLAMFLATSIAIGVSVAHKYLDRDEARVALLLLVCTYYGTLYLVFIYARDTRAAQSVREDYYRNSARFFEPIFSPVRTVTNAERRDATRHLVRELWLTPFIASLLFLLVYWYISAHQVAHN